MRPDTALVSIMTINNEIGVRQPIEEIGILCLQSLLYSLPAEPTSAEIDYSVSYTCPQERCVARGRSSSTQTQLRCSRVLSTAVFHEVQAPLSLSLSLSSTGSGQGSSGCELHDSRPHVHQWPQAVRAKGCGGTVRAAETASEAGAHHEWRRPGEVRQGHLCRPREISCLPLSL